MSIKGGPNIVTNGLIQYFDAKNLDSADGGNVWYDLSGTHNGTIVGANYNTKGYYEFGNATDIVSNVDFTIDSSSDWSFSQWQWIPDDWPGSWSAFFGTPNGHGGYWMWHTQGELKYYQDYYDDGGGSEYYGTFAFENTKVAPGFIETNKWFNVMLVYNGNTSEVTAIINGDEIIETVTITWSPRPINSIIFRLIGNTSTGRFFTGNIATHMVWDRALSNAEVLQNYNSLKSRFE